MEGDILKIGEAGITMTVPKGGDYDKAVSPASTELDSYLNDVKSTKKPAKKLRLTEWKRLCWTAKDADKEDVEFDLTVIKAPKNPVLATIYADKASMEKHGADVQKFLQSVKKQWYFSTESIH